MSAKERYSGPVLVGKHDVFIATAWWTALLADQSIRSLAFSEKKFVYLIQDYEPCLYPWSQDFALAEYSYKLDYVPIFNTRFPRRVFQAEQAGDREAGLDAQARSRSGYVLSRAIERMRRKGKKRVLIYGRPTIHRNLFGCLVCGLDEWIRRKGFSAEELGDCQRG